MSENAYSVVWDALNDTIGAAKRKGVRGSIKEQDHLSIDQRLKVAEVAALLSIAQEISALNPQNTTFTDKDGIRRNGWGLETHSDASKP